MPVRFRVCVPLLLVFSIAGTAYSMQPATAPTQPAPAGTSPATKSDEKNAGGKILTPQERLDATSKLYSELKSYRDEGTLIQVMDVSGQKIKDTKTFTTAFEREGRFRWQFRHSTMGAPNPQHRYTIWSKDGRSFDRYWTLDKSLTQGEGLDMPLAGATGVSGGAATVIVPMLHVTQDAAWGLNTTSLLAPSDKGKEPVDGVDCWKIEGKQSFGDATVTLWIDADGLIRKVHDEKVIDPAKIAAEMEKAGQKMPGGMPIGPKFAVVTTITIKPWINEPKIDDSKFLPDEKDAADPAK